MDPSRESGFLSEKLDEAWDRRVRSAEEWNRRLASGEHQPGFLRRARWCIRACLLNSKLAGKSYSERRRALEKEWREVSGVMEPSIAWALNDTFGWHFWAGGLFKVGFRSYQIGM